MIRFEIDGMETCEGSNVNDWHKGPFLTGCGGFIPIDIACLECGKESRHTDWPQHIQDIAAELKYDVNSILYAELNARKYTWYPQFSDSEIIKCAQIESMLIQDGKLSYNTEKRNGRNY